MVTGDVSYGIVGLELTVSPATHGRAQAASTMNPMARTASQSRGMQMAVMDEDSERALANMARAARKIGPNDRVVELRKVK